MTSSPPFFFLSRTNISFVIELPLSIWDRLTTMQRRDKKTNHSVVNFFKQIGCSWWTNTGLWRGGQTLGHLVGSLFTCAITFS